MSGCKGLSGYLFGHRYEARYSERIPDELRLNSRDFEGSVAAYKAVMNAQRGVAVYHGDVCSRCGSVVNDTGDE